MQPLESMRKDSSKLRWKNGVEGDDTICKFKHFDRNARDIAVMICPNYLKKTKIPKLTFFTQYIFIKKK